MSKVAHATIGGEVIISLGMSQSGLAAELGTVREVVVRALRSLRKHGVIANAGRGRIRVVDVAALRRVADNTGGA